MRVGNSREVPCMHPFLHFNATSYLPCRGGSALCADSPFTPFNATNVGNIYGIINFFMIFLHSVAFQEQAYGNHIVY